MKPLLLATQSRYKIALFEKLGLPYQAVTPPFDEHLTNALAPAELAQTLARGKAQALTATYPDHVIIGADQVLALGDEVMGKPGSVEAAVEQLMRLTGQTHRLHTAVSVLDAATGQCLEAVETATIRFWPNLNRDFLRTLVERDQTTDCAGAYKFESGGILLMESVQVEDPNAIVGLPLMQLARLLGQLGYLRERFA